MKNSEEPKILLCAENFVRKSNCEISRKGEDVSLGL
jgi:hypothetical protein